MADPELTTHQAFKPAAAPLVVSAANPRYFTFATVDGANRKAVYLAPFADPHPAVLYLRIIGE